MASSPTRNVRTEARMKQCNRDFSPERAKLVRMEPKTKLPKKVQVLYYLSRNGQLEHPHVMEVTLSSNEGLYLRDVLNRLNVLRGKGMPYLFSWSSKRSYKNGYVWHDLAEDDVIIPTHGSDYVLKGSELFEGSTERVQQTLNPKPNTLKPFLDPSLPAKYQDLVSSTSKSVIIQQAKSNHMADCKIARTDSREHMCNGADPVAKPIVPVKATAYGRESTEDYKNPAMANKLYGGEASWCSSDVAEYKVYKAESVTSAVDQGADAATQTDDRRKVRCTRGVSTEEDEECNSKVFVSKESHQEDQKPTELSGTDVSPPPSSSGSPGSPNSKTKPNSDKAEKLKTQQVQENYIVPLRPKASAVLMQLISCGSIAVKDHSFGSAFRSKSLISSSEPKPTQAKVALTRVPASKRVVIDEDLECMSDNARFAKLQIEEKEYFSGSIVETKTEKERGEGEPGLKRCASYNADRSTANSDILDKEKEEDSVGVRTKCVPRKIKSSKKQQPKSSILKTPSRFSKVPSKLGRSFNSATAVSLPEDARVDANTTCDHNFGKELQKSESFTSFRGEHKLSESLANSFHEGKKDVTKNEWPPCTEPKANLSAAEQTTLPTIELRQYLEECKHAEAAENGAKTNLSSV